MPRFSGLADYSRATLNMPFIPGYGLDLNTSLVYSIAPLVAVAQVMAESMNPVESTLSPGQSTTLSPVDINSTVGGTSRACGEWKSGQHTLFQTAQFCIAVASLIPHRFRISTVLTRSLFTVGYLLTSLWSGLVVCSPDIMGWSISYFLINGSYTIYLLWRNIPPRINAEYWPLYEKLFLPFLVERRLFNRFVRSSKRVTMDIDKRYSVEGITMADEKISILISGKMQVTCEGVLLHFIGPNEFVDSPEYESCPIGSEKTSQVTICALEPCVLLTWNRTAFAHTLKQNEFLDNVVYNLVGRDVAHKLYSLNEFHRLGGSGALALKRDQPDWWKKPMQRSVSMDAVNTEARGRVRSVCWAKNLAIEDKPPETAKSDSYAQVKRYQDLIVPSLKPLLCAGRANSAVPPTNLSRQPTLRSARSRPEGEVVEMKRVNFADQTKIISADSRFSDGSATAFD